MGSFRNSTVDAIARAAVALKAAIAGSASQEFSVAAAAVQTQAVSGSQLKDSLDIITNGCMRTNSRPTATLTSAGQYGSVDRFVASIGSGTGVSGTITRTTSVGSTKSGYALLISAASWDAGGAVIVGQRITSQHSSEAAGTITVAAKVYHDFGSAHNFCFSLYAADVKDVFTATTQIGTSSSTVSCSSGTYTEVTATFTGISSAQAANGLFVQLQGTSGAAVSNKNVAVGDFRCAVGSLNIPMSLRPKVVNRLMCEEMYETSFVEGTVAVTAGATTQRIPIRFKTAKFKIPTIIFYNPAATNAEMRDITGALDGSSTGSSQISTLCMQVSCVGNAGTTIGNKLIVNYSADSEV